MIDNDTQNVQRGSDIIRLDRWPVDKTVFLTLDLECDYGTAIRPNHFESASRTRVLTDILEKHSVPLTCFLQTEVIEKAPAGIRTLENSDVDVEFHAHSHTHPSRTEADVQYEVSKSINLVESRFDTNPVGYRFPDGAAHESDYHILSEFGVPFNASLFPSWRPQRFDNRDAPLYPYRHVDSGVVELPFTVYSDRIRIPVALSYLKLLGRPFQWPVRHRPPSTIVFDLHMHDLVEPAAYEELPTPYQMIYSRNSERGADILDQLLCSLSEAGYSFSTMSDLYTQTVNSLS